MIRDGKVMYCKSCGKPVKPDIVFFGEQLPPKFIRTMYEVESKVDLCLIMGTALAVSPFNQLPLMVA